MTKMELMMKIFLVIIVVSFIYGFFHKFRTHSSKNFYSNAEYGKAGPPENYGEGGLFGKVKGRFGKGGGGGNSGGGGGDTGGGM